MAMQAISSDAMKSKTIRCLKTSANALDKIIKDEENAIVPDQDMINKLKNTKNQIQTTTTKAEKLYNQVKAKDPSLLTHSKDDYSLNNLIDLAKKASKGDKDELSAINAEYEQADLSTEEIQDRTAKDWLKQLAHGTCFKGVKVSSLLLGVGATSIALGAMGTSILGILGSVATFAFTASPVGAILAVAGLALKLGPKIAATLNKYAHGKENVENLENLIQHGDSTVYLGQQSGGQPSGGQPSGGQPSGGQPSGGQPSGGQPSGGQPSGGQPSGGQPSGDKPPKKPKPDYTLTDEEKAMMRPEFDHTTVADIEQAIRTGKTDRPELQGLDKASLEILKSAKLKTVAKHRKSSSLQYNGTEPEGEKRAKSIGRSLKNVVAKYPDKVEQLIEAFVSKDKTAFAALGLGSKDGPLARAFDTGENRAIDECLDILLCVKFQLEKQKEAEEAAKKAEEAARAAGKDGKGAERGDEE